MFTIKPLTLARLAAFAIAAFATCAYAQSKDWANLNRLPSGSEIRISLAGGRTLRGFLQTATADSLSVNATTSQETLPRQDIKRVRVKRPGHRGRNTLIGLGVGAACGLAAGAGLDHALSDDWFPSAGKAVFTPIGMVIGTVVGVALPTGGWRDVYRVR